MINNHLFGSFVVVDDGGGGGLELNQSDRDLGTTTCQFVCLSLQFQGYH